MKLTKILLLVFVMLFSASIIAFASGGDENPGNNNNKKGGVISAEHTKYLAAAIAIGCATIASGLAIGRIGSAAMGAISERPEAGGTAIVLAALAEGVCLWGFLIAFFILQ